ncbi:hypothetical protein OTU49_008211, partial [Cherax quadricarinatus]
MERWIWGYHGPAGVAVGRACLPLLVSLLLAATSTATDTQGESRPVSAVEVAPEVFNREELGYNISDVQEDSPLLLDDVDDLPPLRATDQPSAVRNPSGCSTPLGMTSGDVLDWQISASSSYPSVWDPGCHVKYARLHQPNGKAWCAGRKAAGEWVLVDLGVPAKVTGLLIQGKGDDEEWVTAFEVSYSLDAYHWHYARDMYNNKKVFQANVDSHQTRHNFVEPPVEG